LILVRCDIDILYLKTVTISTNSKTTYFRESKEDEPIFDINFFSHLKLLKKKSKIIDSGEVRHRHSTSKNCNRYRQIRKQIYCSSESKEDEPIFDINSSY
jgi:hypothetical protein